MHGVGPLVCPVLVGRDDLLALAERRLDETRAGRGHLLFLAGEAGIGKTRLLGAIERAAAARGFRTARGGTYPGDLEVPAAIFLDLARAMRRRLGLEDAGETIVARLSSLGTAAAATAGDPHHRRRILVLDLADDLAAATADGPLLLALEDLHQADDLTLEVVAALARRAADLPLLVVGTYRSDELYPRVPMREWRSRMLTGRVAEEARLRRLVPAETAQMTSLLLASGDPVSGDVSSAVHDRTDGIPLHVEEFLGLVAATGDAGAAWILGGAPGTAPIPADLSGAVPDTLDASILGRIALRSEAAQELARIGSVIGRSFELGLLAGVAGGDPDGLSRPLEELSDHFLLAPAPASGRYGFRHALIGDAIYARIPDAERRRLHARVASVAAARGDFSDAFLSLQLERAGDRASAHETALRAARAAAAIHAHREAFELFARARRTVPREQRRAERAALDEAFGLAAAAIDDNESAVEALEAARTGYLAAGRPVEAAAVVVPIVAARHLLGDDLDTRVGRLTAALAEVRASGADPREVDRVAGRLEAGIAAAYMLNRHLGQGMAHAEDAMRLAGAAGDAETMDNARITLASCLPFTGRLDESTALLVAAIGEARDRAAEAEASRGYRMISSIASVILEYEAGERWLREGIAYAERAERWNDRHYMAAHLAHVLWATGRWDEAAAVAEQARLDGRGGITTRITALHVLGYVALGRGQWDRATVALEEARAEGARMGELQRLSPALWGLAETALLRGDAATAARIAEEARLASLEVRDAAYLFPFMVTGARAMLTLADPAGAARFVDATAAELAHRAIPGTLPAIAHARGLLALAAGSTGEARRLVAEGVAGWDGRSRTWEAAWGRLDLARALVRSNRRADALRLVATVEAWANERGAAPLLAAARDVRGRSRGGDALDEPWAPLTPREWEVAVLLADGLTNAAVAARLGVAPKTASAHVEHILAKLGVGRRAEVAAWVATIRARQPPHQELAKEDPWARSRSGA